MTNSPSLLRFFAWFAGSKVVDAAGQPLVVFHGTDRVFAEFTIDGSETAMFVPGAHFTDSSDYAALFPKRVLDASRRIVCAYLSLQRPWMGTDRAFRALQGKVAREHGIDQKRYGAHRVLLEKMQQALAGHDGVILQRTTTEGTSGCPVEYIAFQPGQVRIIGTIPGDGDYLLPDEPRV